MTQTNMADKDKRKPNRIPVRFVGDEGQNERGAVEQPDVKSEGGPTPDEVGHESAYEDATETKRRVERGEEKDTEAGRVGADDEDLAGGPDPSELPRSRTDQDTTVSHTDEERSEEHTSELQSLRHLVCRLLLEKKKTK